MEKTKDKLTHRHIVERQQVHKNIEQNLNGMCWDDWVEWAERRDLTKKQTLLGKDKRYREMYLSQMEETND